MILKVIFPVFLLAIGVSCAPGSALLGAKECTWGPSYWCKNLTSAHGCHAVPHCIKNVWEHQTVPEDPDDICTLCKNMVAQARDQLESNMTMEEMKEVFEGTCKAFYVKPAVKICDKIADELVPELVEAISSQMNPDMCCSVAGLCNNAEIDEALKEHAKQKSDNAPKENCNICEKFLKRTEKKMNALSSSDLMNYLLDVCGKLSSYSDSCASLILTHFDMIEKTLRKPVVPEEFCYISGSCLSTRKPTTGDETCDLCKQLVLHFKDVVTANTTAVEFRKVLHGVCKQTGKFKDECDSLVDEYSDLLFRVIANDLNGAEICGFFNVCPAPGVYINGPARPILPEMPLPVRPVPTIAYGDSISKLIVKSDELYVGKAVVSLLGDTKINGQQTCIFCQYFLHYVQKVITQPYGEDAIKKVVDKACDLLPKSMEIECRDFVNLYGDAFVALLAQEIDPSLVCPGVKVCPSVEMEPLTGKPGCPLCLMAMTALEDDLANNKTEASVKLALEKVCTKLPKALQNQCDSLVDEYTQELVDMLVADFTPEEVCTYLKICKKPEKVMLINDALVEPYEIRTNEVAVPEIETNLLDNHMEKKVDIPGICQLCELVVGKVANLIDQNKTAEGIEMALDYFCDAMPEPTRTDCNQFVNKYLKEMLAVIAKEGGTQLFCMMIEACVTEKTVDECAMCSQIAGLQKLLIRGEDLAVDRTNFLMSVCDGVNDDQGHECQEFMKKHGVNMFNTFTTKSDDVCGNLQLCGHSTTAKVVLEKKPIILGADKCTHGPGFWCKSTENAAMCGAGAVKHCQDNVWPF